MMWNSAEQLITMYSLKDMVVLITGAANGIGATLVPILLEEGAKHIRILDIDEIAGKSLQSELDQKYGDSKIKYIKCDITKDELFSAYEDIMKDFGQIDLVINNAGVTHESNCHLIRKTIEINLTALINSTFKAVELMRMDKGGKGGTVINISSVVSLIKISPSFLVYSATKSAVLHFSNCIGKEPYYSKTGVRVITICYGPTKTDLIDNMAMYDESINVQDLVANHPLQTSEIAAAGTLHAIKNGKNGSTWLIHNGKPAKDITNTLENAYKEIASVFEDD